MDGVVEGPGSNPPAGQANPGPTVCSGFFGFNCWGPILLRFGLDMWQLIVHCFDFPPYQSDTSVLM